MRLVNAKRQEIDTEARGYAEIELIKAKAKA